MNFEGDEEGFWLFGEEAAEVVMVDTPHLRVRKYGERYEHLAWVRRSNAGSTNKSDVKSLCLPFRLKGQSGIKEIF